jgi:hypothetical protein
MVPSAIVDQVRPTSVRPQNLRHRPNRGSIVSRSDTGFASGYTYLSTAITTHPLARRFGLGYKSSWMSCSKAACLPCLCAGSPAAFRCPPGRSYPPETGSWIGIEVSRTSCWPFIRHFTIDVTSA